MTHFPPRAAPDTIFVKIAAYRDPECEATIADLFANAAHPERISVGVFWQAIPGLDDDLLPLRVRREQIRFASVDARESYGACWARHMAEQLWSGETYLLQIDSHMRFEPRWDERLIAQLKACPSDKPVLSVYPPAYTPPRELSPRMTMTMAAARFNADGVLTFISRPLGEPPAITAPISGMFCAAGFLFGSASILQDVPYDPYLYFYGEEILNSVRLWTHGYDIFHPCDNVLYHYYRAPGDPTNPTHWADNEDWATLHRSAVARAHHLLTGAPTDDEAALLDLATYGLGTVRNLAAYEAASGIDFQQLTIAPKAKEGFVAPSPVQFTSMNAEWREWVAASLGHMATAEIKRVLIETGFTLPVIAEVMGEHFPA